jgi:tartrate dehydratase alpha subunit/fumarate hydratase class I-like protein
MLALKTWPIVGTPADNGLVVVVLHPGNRATVLVAPRAGGSENVEELDMAMPMALYRAQVEATRHGFAHVWIAAGEGAPWDQAWGRLE